MNTQQLAAAIEKLQPDAGPVEVARLCLLLSNSVEDLKTLGDQAHLTQAWKQVNLMLQASTDQHAAMTSELEELASSDPKQFTADQIWVLLRAIKVQSQILELYLGRPLLNV